MKVFDYLQTKFGLSDFVIEVLDHHGYDSYEKLQMLDEEAVTELDKSVEENLLNWEYFRYYWGEDNYQNALSDKPAFLQLKYADRILLKHLPVKIAKTTTLKDRRQLSSPPTYTQSKRKRDNSLDDNESSDDTEDWGENSSSIENFKPAKKKQKLLEGNEEELALSFHQFVTKHFKTEDVAEILSMTYDPPKQKFFTTCVKCNRNVSVGFRTNKHGKPIFFNTNLKQHKCYATIESQNL